MRILSFITALIFVACGTTNTDDPHKSVDCNATAWAAALPQYSSLKWETCEQECAAPFGFGSGDETRYCWTRIEDGSGAPHAIEIPGHLGPDGLWGFCVPHSDAQGFTSVVFEECTTQPPPVCMQQSAGCDGPEPTP